MRTKMQTKKKSWIEQFHYVRYFSANENKQNVMSDHDGIHSEGDKFEYIVDWQVGEKKSKDVMH